MYGNMTREEMIQRLYEGNFTTGELERQLIAKLFEQCCGGGGGDGDGGSSGGGGAFVVNVSLSEDALTMDKTAKEIWEAAQSSTVIVRMPPLDEYDAVTMVHDAKKRIDASLNNLLRGGASKYRFNVDGTNFVASADDEYPHYFQSA